MSKMWLNNFSFYSGVLSTELFTKSHKNAYDFKVDMDPFITKETLLHPNFELKKITLKKSERHNPGYSCSKSVHSNTSNTALQMLRCQRFLILESWF